MEITSSRKYPDKKTSSARTEGLSKTIPHSKDIEEAVLGALLIEKESYDIIKDVLTPDSFYNSAHILIFKAIADLKAKSESIDLLTLTKLLRERQELEKVGGAYYLTELTSRVNSAANIEYHARILMADFIKRRLIEVSSKIQNKAFNDDTDVFELLDETDKYLFEITNSNIKRKYQSMGDLMKIAFDDLAYKRNLKDGLTGVPTGFSALDRVTSGWQKSDLVIIAARPGMGKTAFVVSAIRNAAVDFNMPVALFSLEMSAVQLVNRMISSECEIESEKIKKGTLSEEEWTRLYENTKMLNEAPVFIDDTPALSILDLRAKCQRLKSQHDIKLIVIDYLQLMTGDTSKGGGSGGNREQEIASISRALKNIAKELDVPVIALSQLSRAVETRGGDKRPQLSDLRESGSIEQDADMVMFLYRPEYYQITEDEYGVSTLNVGEVIIAKHRNGSLETVPLKFIGQFTKFADLDYVSGGLTRTEGITQKSIAQSKLNSK